jgi:hypothetical protein
MKDNNDIGDLLVMAYYDEKLWPAMDKTLEKAVGRRSQETCSWFMADGSPQPPREIGWWCKTQNEVKRVTGTINNLVSVRVFDCTNGECEERKVLHQTEPGAVS